MTATAAQFGLSAIGQIFIRARDLDRAVRFYRGTLGMPFLFQAPPQMAFFQCGGTTVMLGVPEAPELDHPASLVIEFGSFGDAEHDRRAAALEERHLGRRLEEKRHAERAAVETNGAIQVPRPDEDLADRGETELRGCGSHCSPPGAGSCCVKQ